MPKRTRQRGVRPKLPTGPNLTGYREVTNVPQQILAVFPLDDLEHGEAIRFNWTLRHLIKKSLRWTRRISVPKASASSFSLSLPAEF